MKPKKKFSFYDLPIITILFVVIGSLIVSYVGLQLHEETHKTIYSYYGIESEIHYNSFFIPYEVQGEKPCPSSTSCRASQDLVDIIGYQLVPIYLLLFVGIAFIILTLEDGGKA